MLDKIRNIGAQYTTDLNEKSIYQLVNAISLILIISSIVMETVVLISVGFIAISVSLAIFTILCSLTVLIFNSKGKLNYSKITFILYCETALIFTLLFFDPSRGIQVIFFSAFVLVVVIINKRSNILIINFITLCIMLVGNYLQEIKVINPVVHLSDEKSFYIKTAIIITAVSVITVITLSLKENLNRYKRKLEDLNRQLNQSLNDVTRENKYLENDLEEKQTLLKEIHHRVNNNMQVIVGLLDLQAMNSENPEHNDDFFQEIKSRIISMSIIHEKLYQSESLKDFKAENYLTELIKNISKTNEYNQLKVTYDIHVDDISIGINQAIPIGLILNEAISNAFKHAFSKKRENKLKIHITESSEQKITILFQDNGPGISPEKQITSKSSSLGLLLINTFTKQLKGSFSQESINGLTTRITYKNQA